MEYRKMIHSAASRRIGALQKQMTEGGQTSFALRPGMKKGPASYKEFVGGMGPKNKALSDEKKRKAWDYYQQKQAHESMR